MNLDAEALRRMLEADKAKGRSDVEAAGIALWLNEQPPRRELLSQEARREAEEVILGWLGDEAGSETSGAQALLAGQLALFLAEHIRYRSEPPDLKIEAAIRRWREETGGQPSGP
jgi:hypothetical protein